MTCDVRWRRDSLSIVLELLARSFAINSFRKNRQMCRNVMDNNSAVVYLKRLGDSFVGPLQSGSCSMRASLETPQFSQRQSPSVSAGKRAFFKIRAIGNFAKKFAASAGRNLTLASDAYVWPTQAC